MFNIYCHRAVRFWAYRQSLMWIITTTVCLAYFPLSCGVSDLLCSCGFTCDVQHAAGVWRGPRLWLNNNHRCVRKPENAGWTAGVTQHLECRRGCVFFCRHYNGWRRLLKAHMYAVSIFFFTAAPLVKSAELMSQFWLSTDWGMLTTAVKPERETTGCRF